MRKLIYVLVSALVWANEVIGQDDLSFYHMKESTPLHGIYSPVSFPQGRWYVSLPGLSGVNLNVNTGLTYNDIFESVASTDSVRISTTNMLSKLDGDSKMNIATTISLFQFGLKLKDYGAVHLSINERIEGGMSYPSELLNYLVNGNAGFLGQTITQQMSGNANYYREYGLGYSHRLQILGNKELRVGARVKMLQGMLYAEVNDQARLSFLTEAERSHMTLGVDNFSVKTAGFDALSNDVGYLISNGNKGMGLDLGADLAVTDKLNVSFSINDLGSINWEESLETHAMDDSQLRLDFLDLKNLDESIDVLTDTIENLIELQEVEAKSFKSKLNTRVFLSGDYKVIKKGTVHATILARQHVDKYLYSYGAGYTQQLGNTLTVSSTLSYNTISGVQWGGALASQLGPAQLHLGFNNMIGFGDVTNLENINFRFGISFIFGRSRADKALNPNEKKEKTKDPDFDPFKYIDGEEQSPNN